MSLQNLQAEIAEAILSGDLNIDLVTPAENIIIYENNRYASLAKSLTCIYPYIIKLVGEDCFRSIIDEYIRRYPARTGDLNEYGAYLKDFFLEFAPLENLPYLHEVATFEWAYHTVSLAAFHPALDVSILKNLSPPDYEHLYFVLHPACQLLQFQYPILKIISLCKGETEDTINLKDDEINLLMIRPETEIKLITLTPGEFIFLSSIHEGMPVTAALNATLQTDPHFNLEAHLPSWIADKIIVESYS